MTIFGIIEIKCVEISWELSLKGSNKVEKNATIECPQFGRSNRPIFVPKLLDFDEKKGRYIFRKRGKILNFSRDWELNLIG